MYLVVIHTVGPIGEIPDKLESCYKRCLDIVAQHNVRTIAFCGVSTGVYGYPLYAASRYVHLLISHQGANSRLELP